MSEHNVIQFPGNFKPARVASPEEIHAFGLSVVAEALQGGPSVDDPRVEEMTAALNARIFEGGSRIYDPSPQIQPNGAVDFPSDYPTDGVA